MIHETIEEFRIMLYLICYGIFCISSYDTLLFFINNFKKIFKLSISIIYALLMIYFTYEFSYVLANGYIPIHFILFLIIGFLIYFVIRRIYIEGLTYIRDIFLKIRKPFIKIVIFLVYPKEIIDIIKLIILTIMMTFKNFYKELKTKKRKME